MRPMSSSSRRDRGHTMRDEYQSQIVDLAVCCEFQMRCEAEYVARGEYIQAALAADSAEQLSALAFEVAVVAA